MSDRDDFLRDALATAAWTGPASTGMICHRCLAFTLEGTDFTHPDLGAYNCALLTLCPPCAEALTTPTKEE